jgi:hypothetical protein
VAESRREIVGSTPSFTACVTFGPSSYRTAITGAAQLLLSVEVRYVKLPKASGLLSTKVSIHSTLHAATSRSHASAFT